MKLLINEGTYEILTPPAVMDNQLVSIEKAGRTCYQSQEKITKISAFAFVKMLIKRGHEAMVEHSHLMVVFDFISRGMTHETVRHRVASFGQESTRYVDPSDNIDDMDMMCICPPHCDPDENMDVEMSGGGLMSLTPRGMFDMIERFYKATRKAGWAKQDSRQFLPIGIKSQIVVSTNLREWRHIFSLRCDKPAHWEIRRVMCNLLEELQNQIPVVFDDFYEAGVDANGLRYFRKRFSLPHAIKDAVHSLAKLVMGRRGSVDAAWDAEAAKALDTLQANDPDWNELS